MSVPATVTPTLGTWSANQVARCYALVKRRARGVGRHHGELRAALAAQNRAPQTLRSGVHRVPRSPVDDEPGASLDLALQLAGIPSGVTGEDPKPLHWNLLRRQIEIDHPELAEHGLPARSRREVVDFGSGDPEANRGGLFHRPANEYDRGRRGAVPPGR